MRIIFTLLLLALPCLGSAENSTSFSEEEISGAKLYRQHCVQCHGNMGTGDGVVAVSTPDYPDTSLRKMDSDAMADSRLFEVIENGCANYSKHCFPFPWKNELTDQQIVLTAQYVKLLTLDTGKAFRLQKSILMDTIPTLRAGQELFAARCVRCHGENADGNGPLASSIPGAPPANLHTSHLTFDQQVDIITLGGAEVGRSRSMPPWDDDLMQFEIKSITMFLQSLQANDDESNYFPDEQFRKKWVLPVVAPAPKDNQLTSDRVELGRELFFDPKLSGNGSMSCATCHNPDLGWSDNRKTALGHNGQVLDRATPSVLNAAFCKIQMWDGRFRTLEQQALGPLYAKKEMNQTPAGLLKYLTSEEGYVEQFEQAYPEEGISESTAAKALSSFQRTVIDRDTRFDRWIQGDRRAMSASEVRGFQLFINEDKGKCVVCHSAPNFVDNGFHNLGLAPTDKDNPDLGRFKVIPIKVVKGAFKTPSLRNVSRTAPYFHDGSAATLEEVVEHYMDPDIDRSVGLSPNFTRANLTTQERDDIVAFLHALDSDPKEKDAVRVLAQQH